MHSRNDRASSWPVKYLWSGATGFIGLAILSNVISTMVSLLCAKDDVAAQDTVALTAGLYGLFLNGFIILSVSRLKEQGRLLDTTLGAEEKDAARMGTSENASKLALIALALNSVAMVASVINIALNINKNHGTLSEIPSAWSVPATLINSAASVVGFLVILVLGPRNAELLNAEHANKVVRLEAELQKHRSQISRSEGIVATSFAGADAVAVEISHERGVG